MAPLMPTSTPTRSAYSRRSTTGPGNATTMRGGSHSLRRRQPGQRPTRMTATAARSPERASPVLRPGEPADELRRAPSSTAYNGDGLRAQKKWNGGPPRRTTTTTATRCWRRPTGAGASTPLHTWGADGLVSRRLLGSDTFYQWDPSGNCAARLTSTGSVSGSFAVDGFGATVAGAAGDPYGGFGGQWGAYSDNGGGGQDGLVLLGHRLYNPAGGRFLTRDPIGYRGGVNLYGYTRNNPVNRADPVGLAGTIWQGIDCVAANAALGFALTLPPGHVRDAAVAAAIGYVSRACGAFFFPPKPPVSPPANPGPKGCDTSEEGDGDGELGMILWETIVATGTDTQEREAAQGLAIAQKREMVQERETGRLPN